MCEQLQVGGVPAAEDQQCILTEAAAAAAATAVL
jgi:hypothetical protein